MNVKEKGISNKKIIISLVIIMIVVVVMFVWWYSSGQKSDVPINELPMYGGIEKSEELKLIDEQFVKEAIEAAGSREVASIYYQNEGWDYLDSDDTKTAMKRFNQAWLLTPDDPGVYWGFGAVLGNQKNYEDAIVMFDKALELETEKPSLQADLPRFLCDFANTYNLAYYSGKIEKSQSYLDRANELVKESLALDPSLNCKLYSY